MSSGQPVGAVKSFADLRSLLAAGVAHQADGMSAVQAQPQNSPQFKMHDNTAEAAHPLAGAIGGVAAVRNPDRIQVSAAPAAHDRPVTSGAKPAPSLDGSSQQQVGASDLAAAARDGMSIVPVQRPDPLPLDAPHDKNAETTDPPQGVADGVSSMPLRDLLQEFVTTGPVAQDHASGRDVAPAPSFPDTLEQQLPAADDAAQGQPLEMSGRQVETDREQPTAREPVVNGRDEEHEDGVELQTLRSDLANAEATNKRLDSKLKKLGKALDDEKQRADEASRQYEGERKKTSELKRQVRELRAEADTAAALSIKAQRQADKFQREARRLRRDIEILQARPDLLITDPVLLEWLVQEGGPECVGLGRRDLLGWTGTGPYPPTVFDPLLERLGLQQHDLPDEAISHVVVGRNEWSQELLERQVELRRGKTLRVYSQEMLVAALITRRDPLGSGEDDLLEYFKRDSEGLQFLAGDSLEWPEFFVPAAFPPPPPPPFGLDESPLRLLGYAAGKMGLPEQERRRVLMRGFEADRLPRPNDATDAYMAAWGHSRMPRRLWRIAHHLASLASFHVNKPVARAHWISDLEWLYDAIYIPRDFRFVWPEVSVDR